MSFLQAPPRLPDAWRSDRILRETVAWLVGDELFELADGELAPVGAMATSAATLELARRAEAEPPQHIAYSPWGERVDEIRVSEAWTELGRIGVRAGVTALPYEASPYGDRARIVWAALLSMWGASSALYSCPVAMTDGAARTLLEHGDEHDLQVVELLTTRDPGQAWTSGQWMTETAGGSDVSRTGTVARRDADGSWRLHGTKWFTSATTSEMALTLARMEGGPEGSAGLALFSIMRTLGDGRRNSIVVRRLKDKLGTRALPTAELELEGAIARPVGEPLAGTGVRRMATMLNVTRVHNSLGATSGLARGLAWARAYARVREVFGRRLDTMPAHRATLSDLAVDYAASLALAMRCCELLGRVEKGTAGDADKNLLRGLTTITKLTTGRWSIAGVTEAMEAMGGVGYCEDSTIPALVRNTHVIPIWEGTTNVLALDFLRATERSGSLGALLADMRETVGPLLDDPEVGPPARAVQHACSEIESSSGGLEGDDAKAQAQARSVALSLGASYACARLCAQGAWSARRGSKLTAAAAQRLAQRGLISPPPPGELGLAFDEATETETL